MQRCKIKVPNFNYKYHIASQLKLIFLNIIIQISVLVKSNNNQVNICLVTGLFICVSVKNNFFFLPDTSLSIVGSW